MSAQHTPGPWAWYDGEKDLTCLYRMDSAGQTVSPVMVFALDVKAANEFEENECFVEPSRADARLIASAPELLAACQEALRDLIADGHSHYRVADQLREVIAKATGSTAA